MQIKKDIRKYFLDKRTSMAQSEVLEKSRQICDRLKQIPAILEASDIHVYYPIRNEVDIKSFIEWIWSQEKKVVMPRAIFKTRELENYYIISFGQLEETKYGLFEPRKISPLHLGSPDVIIVPGVAFTADKYRLGYGGGFYDRFLRKSFSLKIGVAYENQLADKLPLEEHDHKLDMIATEERLIL